LLVSGGVILGVSRYAEITHDLPSPDELEILLDPISGSLLEPTRIQDRSGEHTLWRFENPDIEVRKYAAITDGETIFYTEVPESIILATLAAVDPDYFQRPVAFFASILDNSQDPIPETLVSDLLLWQEVDQPFYDFRMRLLADQIIATYGREKILEWYLNSAYYGKEIYGVSQAAEFYFGKDLEDLELGESALLAAVVRYPALNPLDAPVAAKDNQSQVLDQMVEAGFITSQEAEKTEKARLIFADPEQGGDIHLPSFVSYLLDQAGEIIPPDRLIRGGFKIISTLDNELQDDLSCTLNIMSQRVYGQDPQLVSECEPARLLPRYDGINLQSEDPLDLALSVYDPIKGEVLGMVGFSETGESPKFELPRDPGSLITPYLYLNAFTQGFGPASLVWDIPLSENGPGVEDLHPGTKAGAEYLGPVSMRTALANDLLSPAVQLLDTQGMHQILTTLGLFGHTTPSTSIQGISSALESPSLEILDLLQGFGVFVNQGYLTGHVSGSSGLEVQPVMILGIQDLGRAEYLPDDFTQEKKVISEELAFLINHILSDHEARLDSQMADIFRIGRPVSVKTGYVEGNRSGWVIGYTPQIVVGAWTGGLAPGEDGKEIEPVGIASFLWRAVTQYVSRDSSALDWEVPLGISSVDVCYPSGNLPTENCLRTVREVFIQGNEPLGPDGLYQALEINRETGLLASVFTPTTQIDERVYLNIPPIADSWAETVGIEAPPILYDLGDGDKEVGSLSITAPENLSFVRGLVGIHGSVPEEGFVSARLQYGIGLNPRSWLQIGPDITSPAENRLLGRWDTTDLEEGIYALQLVVIQEAQQIEKRSLILSVDNTVPEIIMITDLADREIPFQSGRDLLIEVGFANPSEIALVEFYMDGNLVTSRRIDPFIIPWRYVMGAHELTIRATDQAGNKAEQSVEFRVIRE
jgi:membrane peptidoglycan carboxypeptidase